ncbi:macro domain-containing protein [Paludifilum halophilum]|nr:macro domain-containing protein [Paludifilum halophilum]
MIFYETGSILNAKSEAIVNPINCMGGLENGPMLLLKQAYPENFIAFRRACRLRKVKLGRMLVIPLSPREGRGSDPRYIINFPVKKHWRHHPKMNHIREGLKDLARTCAQFRLHSVAIPALGCEPGGPEWKEVQEGIMDTFRNANPIRIHLFPPPDVQ